MPGGSLVTVPEPDLRTVRVHVPSAQGGKVVVVWARTLEAEPTSIEE